MLDYSKIRILHEITPFFVTFITVRPFRKSQNGIGSTI